MTLIGKCFSTGVFQCGLLLEARGECYLGDRLLSSHVWVKPHFSNERALLQADRELTGKLFVTLDAAAINYIEEVRAGGDITLGFSLVTRWQGAVMTNPNSIGETISPGVVYWQERRFDHRISQSDWLGLLSSMEWQDWVLFECPTSPQVFDDKFSRAVEHLQEAQELLRQGNCDASMAECRTALESLAKSHANGDMKTGVPSLLSRAYSKPPENQKADLIDPIMKTLSNLVHRLGRHAQVPWIPVTRPEAEFVLATTAALMSMLGRGIVDAEKHSSAKA